MAFSEQVKLEVKRKAAFRCCRCQSVGVDVHHIIPEKMGGPDEMDNAAPLCPNCHDYYGGNPDKRKEITQMRDWWYERAASVYGSGLDQTRLSRINDSLLNISEAQNKQDLKYEQEFSHLKSMLRPVLDQLIDTMTLGTAVTTTSGIINVIAAQGSDSNVPTSFRCWKCGRNSGPQFSSICPNCGADNNPP
jgi:Zn finger protein HypA/HybF involved in hydrogenase expression